MFSPDIYMVYSLDSSAPCYHVAFSLLSPISLFKSGSQPLFPVVLILFSFPPEHFSYIMHFSYSFCLLSVSPQGMWPIEGRHFSEFYLPHVHTEQCLAQSWCPKLRVERVRGRPQDGVRRATPAGFLLNQRCNLEAHKAFSFTCTVYF